MRRLTALVLAVGASCLFLLIQLAGSGGSPVPEISPEKHTSRDRAQAPRLAPRLATLESPSGIAADSTAPAPDSLPPTDIPPTGDAEMQEVLAEQKVERAALRERLAARLAAEGRDTDWASAIESDLSNSIAEFSEVAALESVECRSTLCALVMSHTNPDSQRQAMNDLAGSPGFHLAGKAHLEFDRDQGARTYIYLSREGDFVVAD